jgi:hypothetical protein
MGAAASVDFRSVPGGALDGARFSQNLELQGAANWARIIQHAASGGPGRAAADTHTLTHTHSDASQTQDVAFSRPAHSGYTVHRPGDQPEGSVVPPQPLPSASASANADIFNTARASRAPGEARPPAVPALQGAGAGAAPAAAAAYRRSESVPVTMRLVRRSGALLVLEWDTDGWARAAAGDGDGDGKPESKSASEPQTGLGGSAGVIGYDIIARQCPEGGAGAVWAGGWVLICSGALLAPSLAVACPRCNAVFSFRCRRVLAAGPAPAGTDTGTGAGGADSKEHASGSASAPSLCPSLCGSWSAPLSVRTGPGPPGAVPRVQLLEVGCSAVRVSWRAPLSDNGLPVLRYAFRLYTETPTAPAPASALAPAPASALAPAPASAGSMQGPEQRPAGELALPLPPCAGPGPGPGPGVPLQLQLQLVSETWLDVYAPAFACPLLLAAPAVPLRPDTRYRLCVSAANLAGEGPGPGPILGKGAGKGAGGLLDSDSDSNCNSDSNSGSACFRTRALHELPMSPWVFAVTDTGGGGGGMGGGQGYYTHLATGSVAPRLPPGALLDGELSFANKLAHFRARVLRRRLELRAEDPAAGAGAEGEGGVEGGARPSPSPERLISPLVVSRANLLQDSLTLLGYSDVLELEKDPIRIRFEGEQGIDSGGLAKDWYSALAAALVDPAGGGGGGGGLGLLSCYEGAAVEVSRAEPEPARYKSDRSRSPSSAGGGGGGGGDGLGPAVTAVASMPIVGLGLRGGGAARLAAEAGAEIEAGAGAEAEQDPFRCVGLFLGKALADERAIGYSLDPVLLKWMLFANNSDNDNTDNTVSCGGSATGGEAKEEYAKCGSSTCSSINGCSGLSPRIPEAEGEGEGGTGGGAPTLLDLARSDYRLYSSLRWVAGASPAELRAAQLTFSASRPRAAASAAVADTGADTDTDTVELVPGGGGVVVTPANRRQFVRLLFAWLVRGRLEPALGALLAGFRAVVPRDSLRHLSPPELGLMLAGRVVVRAADLRRHAAYAGLKFSPAHALAGWVWEVLESLDQKTLARFLLFVTGSPCMPVAGYAPPLSVTMHDYSGGGGGVAAEAEAAGASEDTCTNAAINTNNDANDRRLPEAHTCFNQIVFPEYSSKEILENKLRYAVENNGNFFSIL